MIPLERDCVYFCVEEIFSVCRLEAPQNTARHMIEAR
jgi:hypothetical protein